jgi:hypothetical protein
VDSYIVWSSLLEYLSKLDPNQPIYAGQNIVAGPELTFQAGDSGIVMSKPAMQVYSDFYAQNKDEMEHVVHNRGAGDLALGKAMNMSEMSATNAWPVLQSASPGWLTFAAAENRTMVNSIAEVWCAPVATFHHVTPSVIREMWDLEQQWLAKQDEVRLFCIPRSARKDRCLSLLYLGRSGLHKATRHLRAVHLPTDGPISEVELAWRE